MTTVRDIVNKRDKVLVFVELALQDCDVMGER